LCEKLSLEFLVISVVSSDQVVNLLDREQKFLLM